jgi:uncharacterized protein
MGRDECFRLLEQSSVGRLGVIDGDRPVVLPVNYAVVDGEIVLRTDEGMKLRAAERAPVAFEVDAFDEGARTGWSVLVSGRAEEVTEYAARERQAVRDAPVDPWAGGDKQHWIRIVADSVSGRRIRS